MILTVLVNTNLEKIISSIFEPFYFLFSITNYQLPIPSSKMLLQKHLA